MNRSTLAALAALFLSALPPAHAGDTPELWPGSARQLLAARAGHPQPGTLVLRSPDGRPAYLLSAPCCDQFNPLYDADGRYVCAPSGGFTGRGDGRCPDWVWAALRQSQLLPPPGRPASAPASAPTA